MRSTNVACLESTGAGQNPDLQATSRLTETASVAESSAVVSAKARLESMLKIAMRRKVDVFI
jgi:hypothetical protein